MGLRSAAIALVALWPASAMKNAVLRRLGWQIGGNVGIGPTLVLGVERVRMGSGANIGPFNVFRNLADVRIGDEVKLGQFSYFTASAHMRMQGAPAVLDIGAQSAVTSRHYLDCTGGITIGEFTSVAGERSTFITHGISWVAGAQTYRPIVVGDFCLLSSNLQVAPGTTVGDRIVVGMGATISGALTQPGLYLQPRAALVKPDLTGEYFTRESGVVDEVAPRQ